MKYFTLSIIVCFISFNLSAQDVSIQSQESLLELGLVSTSQNPLSYNNPDMEFEVKGSPYFNDFIEGWIALKNGKDSVEGKKIRYNILADALELHMDTYIMKLDSRPILSFGMTVDGMERVFQNCNYIHGTNEKGYMENVFEGDSISIFLKYETQRDVKDSTEPYGSTKNYVEYDLNSSTYFLYKKKFFKVDGRKDLLFLSNQAEIPKKIKKKDLTNPLFLQDLGSKIEN